MDRKNGWIGRMDGQEEWMDEKDRWMGLKEGWMDGQQSGNEEAFRTARQLDMNLEFVDTCYPKRVKAFLTEEH